MSLEYPLKMGIFLNKIYKQKTSGVKINSDIGGTQSPPDLSSWKCIIIIIWKTRYFRTTCHPVTTFIWLMTASRIFLFTSRRQLWHLCLITRMSTGPTVDILCFYQHLYNQLLKIKYPFHLEILTYVGTSISQITQICSHLKLWIAVKIWIN